MKRRRLRHAEGGYTVLAVMIGVAIVSVALAGHAMMAGVGVLASRQARGALACRTAALERLNGPAPAVDGGSLPPDAPVTGWSDTVFLDPGSGRVVVVDRDHPPAGTPVARQWRRGRDAAGRLVFEVSAVAVDDAGRALGGSLAASAVYSERSR